MQPAIKHLSRQMYTTLRTIAGLTRYRRATSTNGFDGRTLRALAHRNLIQRLANDKIQVTRAGRNILEAHKWGAR